MSPAKLIVEQLVVGQMAANCYVVHDGDEAILIDPGDDGEYIIGKIQETGARLTAIVATHGHFDHIMVGLEVQRGFGVPFYIHPDDVFLVDRMQDSAKHFLKMQPDPPPRVDRKLHDRDIIPLGSFKIRVMHTPGHTPGGVTLFDPKSKIAFVGDVLFAGGAIGRSDFSYSDPDELGKSVQKILTFPKDFTLYPGHGEKTTIRSSIIDCKRA